MHSFGTGVFKRQGDALRTGRGTLRATASVLLALIAGLPTGFAQQQQPVASGSSRQQASELPPAPTPTATEPVWMRPSSRDFSKPAHPLLGNPIEVYLPSNIAKANFNNSVRLGDLVKDGKIYLSLSDALALAIENNYDIAISRYYFDIADTDLLRAKAGQGLRGVGATVLQNTLGGASQTLSASGAPGTVSGATAGSA